MVHDRRAVRCSWLDRVLMACGLAAYAAGAAARLYYGLIAHPAEHHVISDAANMLEGAARMLGGEQGRWDTVWPPGETAFVALLSRFDATLRLASLVQIGLSWMVPWLAASVAGQLSSRRGYWVGLAAASLHVGYLHHVGFFLSESLFQTATALAIWSTTTAIGAGTAPLARRGPARRLGLAAGALWALAALFRPNALPIVLCVFAAGLFVSLRTRTRALRSAMLAMLLGAMVLLVPATHRCTVLEGGVCPVSSNFAMNLALGQAGERVGLTFVAPGRPDGSTWTPPALIDHEYQGYDLVPATIFDTWDVLGWVAARVAADPWRAIGYAARNAMDTFSATVWPESYGSWSPEWFPLAASAFVALVVLPAVAGAARVLGTLRSRARTRRDAASFAAAAGVLGVLLLAALSLGEARYRFPFDVWWIALAARAFAAPKPTPPGPRGRLLVLLAAGLGTAALLLLTLVAHPSTSFAARIHPDAGIPVAESIERPAAELAPEVPPGTRWDKGTTILPCAWKCTALRLRWPEPQRAESMRITADHNDTYRVALLRGSARLQVHELPLRRGGRGLAEHRLPIAAEAQGFDEVLIVPLYGDGHYSVGHVIVDRTVPGPGGARGLAGGGKRRPPRAARSSAIPTEAP